MWRWLTQFTAAQAAEKERRCTEAFESMFTAAQAAEKTIRADDVLTYRVFTAAQAAEKTARRSRAM